MLRLNVGFNRKSGEVNYGSRGASVNLELELDSGLAADPERLKERIRFLFGLAKTSVEEELHGQTSNGHAGSSSMSNGNGHADGNANGGANGYRRDATRRATASQVRALHAITKRHKLDLEGLITDRFGIHDPAELSITEASALIDEFKGSASGNGARL